MFKSIISAYILILLFVEISLNIIFVENYDFQRSNISILERFVSNYKFHFFVLHYDEPTLIDIDRIMKILPAVQLVDSGNNFSHPSNTVNIHIIESFSGLSTHRRGPKVFNQDGCNLFLTSEVSEEICQLDIVELASATFIFDVYRNHLFSCFTENGELSLTSIEDYQLETLQTFHKTYRDLRGKSLRVLFINNHATNCRKLEKVTMRCSPTGPDAELLRLLGRMLNFVPDFWKFEPKNNTLIWNDIIKAISEGEADLGAGAIAISADGPVYFTSFTWSSPEYGTWFVNPTKQFNLRMIFKTFDSKVYITSLFAMFLILVLAVAFSYLFSCIQEMKHFSFTLIKMIVEQGSTLNNWLYSSITMRNILSLWLFFNIIFCTTLKSKISSALIKPETYDFKSVEELIQNRYVFVVEELVFRKFYAKYSSNGSKRLRIGLSNLRFSKGICIQALKLFRLRAALVHAEFNLVYLFRTCRKVYPVERLKDNKFFMERSLYNGLALIPSSPLKKQFSVIIDQLKASGIMGYWYKYLTLDSLEGYTKEHAPPKPFALQQIFSFLVFLLAGLGIASTVLILEIIEAAIVRRWNLAISLLEKL